MEMELLVIGCLVMGCLVMGHFVWKLFYTLLIKEFLWTFHRNMPPCSFNEFPWIFKQSTYIIILTAYCEIHLYIFGVQPCCCQPRSSAASCLDTKSAPFCGADPGLRRVTICYLCQDFWTFHGAEDLNRINSSPAVAAGGGGGGKT